MPLIVERMSGVRSAAVSWLVPAGSATDPEDRQGMSTLWAELLLRGAGERDSREQADAMDAIGMARSTDVGGYYLRLSATLLASNLGEALPLLVDMVRRPRAESESIEPSRELALQSLVGLADDPQEHAGVLLTQRHNPVPLNRSSLGSKEGLERATREELLAQWERRARPGGSILAVAGAVEPEAVRERCERLLSGWSGTAAELEIKPSPTAGRASHHTDATNQVQIMVAYPAPAESAAESVLERLAVSVLSGSSSSRLFSEVREKRALCYSVSASYASDRVFGRVVGYVGTTPDKAQQALDVMVEQLRAVTGDGAGGVTADEFERAVVGYKTGLVFAGESTAARAGALSGDMHRLGRPRTLRELADAVDRVRLEDLRAYLAKREIGPMTVVTLGPVELKAG